MHIHKHFGASAKRHARPAGSANQKNTVRIEILVCEFFQTRSWDGSVSYCSWAVSSAHHPQVQDGADFDGLGNFIFGFFFGGERCITILGLALARGNYLGGAKRPSS